MYQGTLYRERTLDELLALLADIKTSPANDKPMQAGRNKVLVRVDRADGTPALVKGEIQVLDMGTHVLLKVKI